MWSLPDSDTGSKRIWIEFEPSGWFSQAVLAAVCLWDRRTFERLKSWILKSTTLGQVDSMGTYRRIVAIHHIRPKWAASLCKFAIYDRMPVLLELVACLPTGWSLQKSALAGIGRYWTY